MKHGSTEDDKISHKIPLSEFSRMASYATLFAYEPDDTKVGQRGHKDSEGNDESACARR